MNRMVLTDSALRVIDDIWDYLAAKSPRSADQLIEEVYREILRIATSPGIGHTRPDLVPENSLLFWPISRYLIVYRCDGAETTILGVLHSSRDLPSVLRHREPEE